MQAASEEYSPTHKFHFAKWWGEVDPRVVAPAELEAAIAKLVDPARAKETLHWGRNYLYTVEIDCYGEPCELAVKQFRNQSWRARRRRKRTGSKAERSWKAAWRLEEFGLRTPHPIVWIESTDNSGPSFFVSELVQDFLEARYYFRALKSGSASSDYPEIERKEFFIALGETIASLHRAGVWHRDLSIGNLLLEDGPGARSPLCVLDLDRSRIVDTLKTTDRLRDLCRLPILDPRDRQVFWNAYWNRPSSLSSPKAMAYRTFQWSFLAKNRWKPWVRKPFGALKDFLVQRKTYAHIPEVPEGAAVRDKAVWDHLSDQPHQHATRKERAAIRMADTGAHFEAFLSTARALPGIWARYTALRPEIQRSRRRWQGAGIAVRPLPGQEEALLDAIRDLGLRNVLLRLHPWQEDHSTEEALARELRSRGYELAFALPQTRDLVRDRQRWRAALTEIAERFGQLGEYFQIGQAINRSKWGIWNYREYLELAAIAREVFSARPGVKLLGPAVIDFEYQVTAAVLNMKRDDVHFDIVSALLYVDRRGAPENEQLGFDTLKKCALLKAITETGRNSGDECWITEVNWPLWEGPHSPAGRTVSVDEETQADFLSRYYLQTLTSGHIARVYWWQLVARGYGLATVTEEGLSRRPSFRALAALEANLTGADFVEARSPTAETRVLRFERGGEVMAVAWAVAGRQEVDFPETISDVISRDDRPVPRTDRHRIELTSSPVFLRFE